MLNDWFRILWALFILVWLAGAGSSKRTVRQESMGSRIVYGGLMAIAVVLIFKFWSLGPLDRRFVPATEGIAVCGLILTAAGLAFAIWARVTLGRNWSGAVTIKQDHRLIREGPYRLVRHPIYFGVLLAMAGTAIGFGSFSGLIGVPIASMALWTKASMEEQFMIEQFGADYIRYQHEVKAIIPRLL